MRRIPPLRYAVISLLAVPVLGLLVIDLMTCVKHNARLRGAADAAARVGLHALETGDASDTAILAATRRHALEELGDAQGAEIAASIAPDRRSVMVTIGRSGVLCWTQVVGLSENKKAVAIASIRPREQRPRSSGSTCPIASFIPC